MKIDALAYSATDNLALSIVRRDAAVSFEMHEESLVHRVEDDDEKMNRIAGEASNVDAAMA
jgi:hypothetical protein